MPDTLSKALLSRMLRSELLRAHLRDFQVLSGMEGLVLDALGNPVLSWPRQSGLTILGMMRATAGGRQRGERSRQELLARLEAGSSGVWEGQGLVEIGHRMHMDDRTVGYWLLSAGRNPQGAAAAEQAWKEHAKEGGTLSWSQWRQAWERLPLCSAEQAEVWRRWMAKAAAELLLHLEEVAAPEPAGNVLPAVVRQACEWVREHHAEPLRLQEVAARCGISAEHLSRLFHQSTGLRFRDFLVETRLNHACAALAESRDRVADIAAAAGFSTLSRFNQAFRAHTGLTPRAWRKRRNVTPRAG